MLRLMIIAVALFIGPLAAKAAPLVFACRGEMRTLGPAGVGQQPWKDSFALKLDLQADTVTIGDYDPVQFGKPSKDEDSVAFSRYRRRHSEYRPGYLTE